MNETLKLAKLQDRALSRQQLISMLDNPVFSVLLAVILIEALQQIKLPSGDYFMSRTGTVLEGALLTEGVLTALAKSGALKQMMDAGGQTAGTLSKLAPLLLAGA